MTYPASPAQPLATQLLHGQHTRLAANVSTERYRLAIAGLGSGPDHLVGEIPLALSDHVHADRFLHGVLFTDRRLLARADDITTELSYPAINDARSRTGVVFDDLEITAWGRIFILKNMPDVQPATMFLQGLLRMPPGYRAPPPRPLCLPTADDPTGGEAARRDIRSRDQRVLPLLGMAIEGHQKGALAPDAAAEQVARAVHFDRTLAYGRGAHEGWWTSPLGAPDLAYAFTRMLGAPYNAWQEGNARVFDFRLSGGSNAGAVASSAVGLLALGVLGVGWVSTPGRSIQHVRLKIAPGNASSGFALYDGNAKLSLEWSRPLKSIFEILPRIEGRMLIQRAAFGWGMPPEQLDELPMEALYRKVAETIGPLEVAIFFPKPPR